LDHTGFIQDYIYLFNINNEEVSSDLSRSCI
jgi:hypothetical protein